MWCPACSRQVDPAGPYCDQCGAALLVSDSIHAPLDAGPVLEPKRSLRRAALAAGLLAAVAAVAATVAIGVSGWPTGPSATPAALREAMRAAVDAGEVPGRDPVCVANGLAYDASPVSVRADIQPTVAWLDTLVEAGLYQPADSAVSSDRGAFGSPPARVYRPLPLLARWGGARRLCVARSAGLDRVDNPGRVDDVSLRGARYPGVSADVRWTLDQPAPWLALPGVAAALMRELPSWRNARWQAGPDGWYLTQRRQFVRVDGRWMLRELAERALRPAADRDSR